jgi:hypothetical protein
MLCLLKAKKCPYTNIMAQQFALVGGGEFKIPFMSDNIGGFKVGAMYSGDWLASTGGGANSRCWYPIN